MWTDISQVCQANSLMTIFSVTETVVIKLFNVLAYWANRLGGYYMAVQKHEISLQVLKNISQVSVANKWNIF